MICHSNGSFYRPRTYYDGKVLFSQVSVCPHWGVGGGVPQGTYPLVQGTYPPSKVLTPPRPRYLPPIHGTYSSPPSEGTYPPPPSKVLTPHSKVPTSLPSWIGLHEVLDMLWLVCLLRSHRDFLAVTDHVHSMTGRLFWLVSVHLSVHTWGGTLARSRQGWGTPASSSLGYPTIRPGWVPHLGYPLSIGPGQGVPHLRYPTSDLARGYPDGGTHLRSLPPSDLAEGYPTLGTPLPLMGGGGYPTSVVLDTPRSVCLLRSRRRTFLFLFFCFVFFKHSAHALTERQHVQLSTNNHIKQCVTVWDK